MTEKEIAEALGASRVVEVSKARGPFGWIDFLTCTCGAFDTNGKPLGPCDKMKSYGDFQTKKA